MQLTIDAFMSDDWKADGNVAALTLVIRALCGRAEMQHVKRLQAGECSLRQGSDYSELLNDLERIAVHSSKIIMAMLEVDSENFHIHLTGEESLKLRDNMIEQAVEKYREQYGLKVSDMQINR